MASSDYGLSKMFAEPMFGSQPSKSKKSKKTKKQSTSADKDVLLSSDKEQILNVLPKQFDQIRGLRAEYYKHLDTILLHYHVVPVIVWVLRSANDLISDITENARQSRTSRTTTPAEVPEPNAKLLRRMTRKLQKLMSQQGKPKVETASTAVTENEDTDALKMRAIRRDLGALPEHDKWIQTVDVIDAIQHIRVPGSLGTYYTRYGEPNPPSLESALSLDELQRVQHLTYDLLTFEPSDEWCLMNALDVTPMPAGGASRSTRSGSKSADVEDEKNRLQLTASTIDGLQQIVENARVEADKYRVLAHELMVKLTQCLELLSSLVETKQAAPVYLTIFNAYVDYAAPHMSARS